MSRTAAVIALSLLLGGVVGGMAMRELFPVTMTEVLPVTRHVTIDLSDSTRALVADSVYEEQAAAAARMEGRLRDRIRELEARPAIVTIDTTIIEVPMRVACEAEAFEPRWRVAELVVGEELGDETIVRSERIEADSGSVVFRPRLEHHVTPGPLLGVYTDVDGAQLRFGAPPPPPCDFWCQMGLRGQGAAIGGLTAALACVVG